MKYPGWVSAAISVLGTVALWLTMPVWLPLLTFLAVWLYMRDAKRGR